MSKYTTELRFICEIKAENLESTDDIQDVIDKSWDKIFNFDFPIWNEDYRETLCKKIIWFYYFREIGYETAGRWRAALVSKMSNIMPYYNKLYAALDEFDPMNATDIYIDREYQSSDTSNRQTTGKNDSTSTGAYSKSGDDDTTDSGTAKGTTSNQNRFLDTPQGGLNGVLDTDYLTNATLDDGSNSMTTSNSRENAYSEKGSSSSDVNATNSGTDDFTGQHTHSEKYHKHGSDDYYKNIERYQQSLYNIDRRVINELEDLFFQLW